MNLEQLVKDLQEIKDCITDNPEKAEDLLGFVIGEITMAAAKRTIHPPISGMEQILVVFEQNTTIKDYEVVQNK